MRAFVGRKFFAHLAAALAVATFSPAGAQPQPTPTDVLDEQRIAVAATVAELQAAYDDADGLCRLSAYKAALARLQDQVAAARRVAQAARRVGEYSAVDAVKATEQVNGYHTTLQIYRQKLAQCEERGLADSAEATDNLHDAAANKCDRAEMQKRIKELEDLQAEAGRFLESVRAASGLGSAAEKIALAQVRKVAAALEQARKRPARNCPPEEDGTAPGSGTQPGSQPANPGTGPKSESQPAVPGSATKPGSESEDSARAGNENVEASIGVSFGEAEIPTAGIGVQRAGPPGAAPEEFAGKTDHRIGLFTFEGGMEFPFAGLRPRISFTYAEGSGSNSFSIPSAGVDSGIVYGALSPSGSSGVIAPFGLSGGTEVDTKRIGVRIATSVLPHLIEKRRDVKEPDSFNVDVFMGYTHSNTDYSGTASGTGTIGVFAFEFSQARDQLLREDLVEAGVKGEVEVPFGPLLFQLSGSASGYYRHSKLRSFELNSCNFCPPADRDFEIRIADSNDGFGFHGHGGISFGHRPSYGILVRVGASVDYWSDVGSIFNPSSGDQVFFEGRTTSLRTESTLSWQAGVGVVIDLNN